MRATLPGGQLVEIPRCQIYIPNAGLFTLRILPDITDAKNATYHDESIMGRSTPIKKYSHSHVFPAHLCRQTMYCTDIKLQTSHRIT